MIPVSAANKFIAAVVKEYFTLLPGRDINSSICSRAIFRTAMVSSELKKYCRLIFFLVIFAVWNKQKKFDLFEIY